MENSRLILPPKKVAALCRRVLTVPPESRISAQHHGRTIYFCNATCQEAYCADPERFYIAHSAPKKP
jgi:YHS domain-containing protein